jgi:hypothetical protein
MIKSPMDYFLEAGAVESPRTAVDGRVECPCCHSMSLTKAGGWQICDVCNWEDDPVQEKHSDLAGGANKVSLNEARLNFARTGVSDPRRRSTDPQV